MFIICMPGYFCPNYSSANLGLVVRKLGKVIHRIATFSSLPKLDLLQWSNVVFSILKLKGEVIIWLKYI